MTTKEKAKAYDEALEQAKKELAACGSMDCDAARLIFRLFPQLRESEDEHFYEREPADSFKYKLAEYMTKCCTKKEGPYGYTYGISAEAILKMAEEELLKRGVVQKPAEWSEEDDKMLQRIIRHTESEYQDWCNDKYGNSEIVSDGKRGCLERLDWLENRLKSLRPQPQQNMSIGFMIYLDEHRPDGKTCLSNAECNEIETAFKNQSWDTIIRYIEKYQPHWKPSEEQMNYLCAAVDAAIRKHNESVSGYEPAIVLKSLYEQLQKLM